MRPRLGLLWAGLWGMGLLGGVCMLPSAAQAAETLSVKADRSEAQALLAEHLDLARALAQQERQPVDALERERLCALTGLQVRQLLETLGLVQPELIELDCAQARLNVKVGPQALVRRLDLNGGGPIEAAPMAAQLATWRASLPLQEGAPFTQAAWADAKRGLLARVRGSGYPLARWASTQAQVDVAAQSVDLQLVLDAGPAVRISRVEIEGLNHHDPNRVRRLLGLEPGQSVSEVSLTAAQARLLKSGLFDSAQVELDVDSLQGEQMAVRVRLRESPLQQLGLGLGWTSNSGERVTLEHQHRLFLGQALRSSLKLAWARDKQELDAELSSHPGARQRRNLAAIRWEREEGTEAPYRQASLRLGQVFETREHDRALLIEALASRQGIGLESSRAEALLLRWNPTWRRLDSVLVPTDGQALLVELAAGPARSEDATGRLKGNLARVHARWQLWQPLSQGRGLAFRVSAGQVFAPSDLDLPESLRWRAGGDESVRGYSHRSLGPQSVGFGGQEIGGRVVWTGSVEASQPLPRTWVGGLEGISAAAFVDAGQAATRWRDAKPAWGGGLGLRWRSPVGLFRADLAKGQKDQGGGWRVHISVGIAL
ncbi:MAG: autotransporter assembly complex protein TamA [Burkholderiales bacterium]